MCIDSTESQALFSSAQHWNKRPRAQRESTGAPSEHRAALCDVWVTECWHRLPRGRGVSSWGSPKPTWMRAWAPALGVAALTGFGPGDPRGVHQPQWFCNPVFCLCCSHALPGDPSPQCEQLQLGAWHRWEPEGWCLPERERRKAEMDVLWLRLVGTTLLSPWNAAFPSPSRLLFESFPLPGRERKPRVSHKSPIKAVLCKS